MAALAVADKNLQMKEICSDLIVSIKLAQEKEKD